MKKITVKRIITNIHYRKYLKTCVQTKADPLKRCMQVLQII